MGKTPKALVEPVQFGKFLLVEQIAVGGMAEIFKGVARTAEGEEQVLAIKRILPQYSSDDEFIHLLIDEAKLMVLLNHPNVVPIVEFGRVENAYYIAMDHVEGTTLKGLFRKVRSRKELFTIDMALHIVREIGSGLAYAHRKTDAKGKSMEIVHRDISPANILLSYEGEVKIADFGISKAANQSHRTQVGVIRGKTGYMSPEQTMSHGVIDQRSDLYSLGIILFELLTGVRLFKAESVPEALRMTRKGEIPKASSVRPEITVELEAIVHKALAHKPADRYQRAEDLVDAINEYLVVTSTGHRPARVTHSDLVGFLGRYYRDEMIAVRRREEAMPMTERETVITREDGVGLKGGRPETLAANPLYEISTPEYDLGTKSTTRQADTENTEPTVPDPIVMLKDAPSGLIRSVQKLPLSLAAGLASLFLFAMSALFYYLVAPEEQRGSRYRSYVEVEIVSDPEGAKILVDDKPKDSVTPAVISVKEAKNVTITLKKEGYLQASRTIRPGAGMLPLHFSLDTVGVPQVPQAMVRITSEPAGAQIFLNDQKMEKVTPAQISVEVDKLYALKLEADGYESRTTQLKVSEPGTTKRVMLVAKKGRGSTAGPNVQIPRLGPRKKKKRKLPSGWLSVNSIPWSVVYLNGKKLNTTPIQRRPLRPGRYTLKFVDQNGGRKPFRTKIRIRSKRVTRCIFDFKTRKAEGCK